MGTGAKHKPLQCVRNTPKALFFPKCLSLIHHTKSSKDVWPLAWHYLSTRTKRRCIGVSPSFWSMHYPTIVWLQMRTNTVKVSSVWIDEGVKFFHTFTRSLQSFLVCCPSPLPLTAVWLHSRGRKAPLPGVLCSTQSSAGIKHHSPCRTNSNCPHGMPVFGNHPSTLTALKLLVLLFAGKKKKQTKTILIASVLFFLSQSSAGPAQQHKAACALSKAFQPTETRRKSSNISSKSQTESN